MWLYLQSEKCLYTVGIFHPNGFQPDSDHVTREAAAARVNYLNGGTGQMPSEGPESGVDLSSTDAEDYR